MSPLIEAKNLWFSWDRRRDAFIRAVNLSLEGGHIYGLVGRNGAGKTTLIKLMTGCLRPTEGQIQFNGTARTISVSTRSPATLADVIYVPENISLPAMSATEFARSAGRLYPKFKGGLFQSHLNSLEVPAKKNLAQLSFGQRRKAHIAFALATEAAVIFLDEPTNGLDIAAQITLRRLLVEHLSPSRSLVVSTHHVRELENVIDQMIVFEQGRILAKESLETLRLVPNYSDLEHWYAALSGIPTSSVSKGGNHESI